MGVQVGMRNSVNGQHGQAWPEPSESREEWCGPGVDGRPPTHLARKDPKVETRSKGDRHEGLLEPMKTNLLTRGRHSLINTKHSTTYCWKFAPGSAGGGAVLVSVGDYAPSFVSFKTSCLSKR